MMAHRMTVLWWVMMMMMRTWWFLPRVGLFSSRGPPMSKAWRASLWCVTIAHALLN
jgi:hypothetical protein